MKILRDVSILRSKIEHVIKITKPKNAMNLDNIPVEVTLFILTETNNTTSTVQVKYCDND